MLTLDTDFISLFIYLFLVVIVIAVMLASCFLGPKHSEAGTGTPYESGILATGNARVKFAAHFYLVAMFFVVFDLESMFLYSWSLSIRELGFMGLIQAAIFISILLITLFYLFRIGAFKIGPVLRRPEREPS
jgi:NADH-quinone oxidoreductase subunit A